MQRTPLPENQAARSRRLHSWRCVRGCKDCSSSRDESDPSVKESAQELEHAIVAWAHIQLAIEVGRDAEALDIAADFLARSRVWSLPPEPDSWMSARREAANARPLGEGASDSAKRSSRAPARRLQRA